MSATADARANRGKVAGGVKGGVKGGVFERLICKKLSLWLTANQRDDCLWRSAMSGGRATVQFRSAQVNRAQAGDVTAIAHEAYAFCEQTFIELKHRKTLGLARSLLTGHGMLAGFWHKTVFEAAKYDKRPLLIARENYFPIIAIAPLDATIFIVPPVLVQQEWRAAVFRLDDALGQPPALLRPPRLILRRPTR